MGLKDEAAKEYVRQPDVFADLFNQHIFHGEQVILPERLRPDDAAEGAIFRGKGKGWRKKKSIQRQRDLLKIFDVAMTDDDMEYWLLGVENQAAIHYAMPVRHALSDTLRFNSQVEQIGQENKKAGRANKNYTSGFLKEDRLKPVVTVVLYLGQKPWDGPMSLHEMCKCSDKRFLDYVMDYRLNLISPLMMRDEEFKQFRTTLSKIMPAIKYASDKKRLVEILSGDPKFLQQMGKPERDMLDAYAGIKIPESREGIDMSNWAFDEILADKKAEGLAEGLAEGRTEATNEMIRSLKADNVPFDVIARAARMPLDYVQNLA